MSDFFWDLGNEDLRQNQEEKCVNVVVFMDGKI